MTAIKRPVVWVPVLLAVLAVAWWLGSPLFLVSRVEEPPPMAVVPERVTTAGGMQDAAISDDMKAGAQPASGSGEMEREPMDPPMEQDAAAPVGTDALAPAGEESMVSGLTGAFRDADSFHRASGAATVVAVVPGQLVLRFEDFKVTNGPDLFVVLTRPGAPAGDGVRLGALKGSEGNQNYPIPADVDLAELSQVVIWCRAFNVTFGTADLAQP